MGEYAGLTGCIPDPGRPSPELEAPGWKDEAPAGANSAQRALSSQRGPGRPAPSFSRASPCVDAAWPRRWSARPQRSLETFEVYRLLPPI